MTVKGLITNVCVGIKNSIEPEPVLCCGGPRLELAPPLWLEELDDTDTGS